MKKYSILSNNDMKLQTKLIVIISLTAIIPIILLAFISLNKTQEALKVSINENFETLAKEKSKSISLILGERINEAELLAQTSEVRTAVVNANKNYAYTSDEAALASIEGIDIRWIQDKEKSKEANEILGRQTSKFLTVYKNRNQDRYGEIFVTDKMGAAIAMTKTLSDYFQADEEWWEKAFASGRGEVFLDDRGYDDSVGALVVGIVVPVMDDNGDVIGILKVNYKIEEILDVVARGKVGETGSAFLVRSDGEVIAVSSSEDHELSEAELDILRGVEKSGSVNYSHDDNDTIMGFASVDANISARVPSESARKGISGEKWEKAKWFLFIEIQQAEAFQDVFALRNIFISIVLLIVLIAVVLSFLIARSITGPIETLTKVVVDISKGKLDTEITMVDRDDEIGELSKAFSRTLTSLKIAMKRTAPEAVKEQKRLKGELETKKMVGDKVKEALDRLDSIVPDDETTNS